MTQEEKDLLFKDLCARLPYGVKCYKSTYRTDLPEEIVCVVNNSNHNCVQLGTYLYKLEHIKPYLFPMSSMTGEQEREYLDTCCTYYWTDETFDWFNKNHFDYRHLIEKGLALDATGLNIY